MKLRISLVLALMALAVGSVPAFAAESAEVGSHYSLPAGSFAQAIAQPFGQEPIAVSGCTAENDNCANGVPISCTGTQSCDVYFCSVVCDGQRKWCCDISGLACPQRACAYCACLAEGYFSEQECSDQACMLFPNGGAAAADCQDDPLVSASWTGAED